MKKLLVFLVATTSAIVVTTLTAISVVSCQPKRVDSDSFKKPIITEEPVVKEPLKQPFYQVLQEINLGKIADNSELTIRTLINNLYLQLHDNDYYLDEITNNLATLHFINNYEGTVKIIFTIKIPDIIINLNDIKTKFISVFSNNNYSNFEDIKRDVINNLSNEVKLIGDVTLSSGEIKGHLFKLPIYVEFVIETNKGFIFDTQNKTELLKISSWWKVKIG